MSVACKCNEGISSLFVGGCEGIVGITSRLVFFPKLDALGVRNSLDVSVTPVPASVINSAFRNVNDKKRFAITPKGMNPTWVQNEDNMQTFDGGQVEKLSNGSNVITMMVTNVSPQEARNYKRLECGKNNIMIVTNSGQLVGYASLEDVQAGRIYGLPVQNISVLAQPVDTYSAKSNVVITITLDQSFDLGKIVTIEPSDILTDMNEVLEPKTAVLSVVTAATSTTTTISVNTEFYGINGAYPIEGLTASDFVVTDLPSTVVTPTSVVETSEGEYTFVYTGVTTGDNLRIDLSPTITANLISGGALTQTI